MRFFKNFSLSAQLTVSSLIAILLLLPISSFALFQLQENALKQNTEARAKKMMSTLSAGILDALIVEDVPILESYVSHLTQTDQEILALTITDENRHNLVDWHRDQRSSQNNEITTHRQILTLEGEIFGTVTMQLDLSDRLHEITLITTRASFFMGMMLILLLGYMVVQYQFLIIKPINNITHRIESFYENQHVEIEPAESESKEFKLLHRTMDHLQGVLDEQQQLNMALRIEKERAEVADKAKAQFLSSMTHELRTPLNAVIGFSELLLLDKTSTPKQIQYGETILSAGELLLKTFDEILSLSRLELGSAQIKISEIEINAVIEKVLLLVESLAHKRGVDIQYNLTESIIVAAETTRLKQVLLNIITNAINYNQRGGWVNIKVDFFDADHVVIDISDSGKGIAERDQLKIFDSFERLDAANSTIEGTGVGLTIAKNLLASMSAEITVSSEVGKGSTFRITLPSHICKS